MCARAKSGASSQAGTSSAKKGKRSKVGFSDLLDVLLAGKESSSRMDGAVRLRVHVGAGLERPMVEAVRDALVAERPGGIVEVLGIEAPSAASDAPDAVLLCAGADEPGAAALSRWYVESGVPCAFLVESSVDSSPDDGPDTVAASDPAAVPAKLGAWLAGVVRNPVALAANFPCCRPAVVSALIAPVALENALVGAIPLIPGSDFPIMCVSQAKLVLDIAAAYGEGAGVSRALEMAGVVGAGLVYRGIARGASGVLPGFGWVAKSGVGFLGTVATARLAQARFEGADSLKDLFDELRRSFAGSGERPAPIAPLMLRLSSPACSGDVDACDPAADSACYIAIG